MPGSLKAPKRSALTAESVALLLPGHSVQQVNLLSPAQERCIITDVTPGIQTRNGFRHGSNIVIR